MKTAVAALCLAMVLVAVDCVPSKRFLSIHDIEHGLHHLGHEIEDGIHHIGHEIEHGVNHLGHELGQITGIHGTKELACKIYPSMKDAGEAGCNAECVPLVTPVLAPVCPLACHMVFHEADNLVDC